MREHRVVSAHAETLADGRMCGPGDAVPDLDLSDPHNQALVDDGLLLPIDPPPDTGQRRPAAGGKPEPKEETR